jgi:hypothetical protein
MILTLNLFGCSTARGTKGNTCNGETAEQFIGIPDMTIMYGTKQLNILVKHGTAGWNYFYNNKITSFVADGLHPLQDYDHMPKIKRTGTIIELKLSFAYPPTKITARYWANDYIGDATAFEKHFQTAEINGNIIVLPSEKKGYIYEVKAEWENTNGTQRRGYSNYSFYVSDISE